MAIFKRVGKTVKPLVNFPSWMGFSGIRGNAKYISGLAKNLYTKEKASHHESFEQAVQRLNLTEADLQNRQHNLRRMVLFYLGISAVLLLYAVYLVFVHTVIGVFLTLILSLVALSFAFREHFRYFQMRQRQLGLSVKQWVKWTFGGHRNEK